MTSTRATSTHPLLLALEAATEEDDASALEKNVAAALEAGLDLNAGVTLRGMTLLHHVCMSRSKHQAAWVRTLLAMGASAVLGDNDGTAPMTLAASRKRMLRTCR